MFLRRLSMPGMQTQYRNVLVLSGCQATLQTTGLIMVAVTGLAGFALAADKAFATVPLTSYVFGSAAAANPASFLMKRIGRRGGFQVGTAMGMAGGAVCVLGMFLADFWLLCAGMFVMGIYTAFGKYYRFAAVNYGSIAAAMATAWLLWLRRNGGRGAAGAIAAARGCPRPAAAAC